VLEEALITYLRYCPIIHLKGHQGWQYVVRIQTKYPQNKGPIHWCCANPLSSKEYKVSCYHSKPLTPRKCPEQLIVVKMVKYPAYMEFHNDVL
jgi:hypothetical protein